MANCLHDATGTATAGLATLAADDGSLARLPLASFTDGPWCGEGASRFDADLLRIRRIRVAVRVQAAQDSFRAAGPGFLVPGSSRGGPAALADFTLSRDIVPRNLNPGR